MLPQTLYPFFAKDLERLGCKYDGGYVLSRKIIKSCKQCITFGLGDNFDFEIDLKKKNPSVKIDVYDHTINYFFWTKHFIFWLWKSFRFRKYLKFLNFIKYIYFFKLKNNNHYKVKVTKKNFVSKILFKNNIIPEKTLLKVDIDGDEYRILDQIKEFNFLGLIIEFENSYKNIKKIVNFVKTNKRLKIIHIHGNNFLPVEKGIPQAIELTFIKSNLINKKNFNKKKYPLKYLDYPNNIMKKDINLLFKKK